MTSGAERAVVLQVHGDGATGPWHRYRLAARETLSNFPLPLVEPGSACPAPPQAGSADKDLADAGWSWHGECLLAARPQAVACRAVDGRLEIALPGVATLTLSAGGRRVDCRPDAEGLSRREGRALLEQALIGPGLLTALAFEGVFALHGSALVDAGGEAVLLCGGSGAGKSTLAARGPAPWRRIADDVTPLGLEPGGAFLLPHYPQLKLSAAEQYPASAPARVPLRRIALLAPADELTIEPLSAPEAATALIGHTVGARVLPPTLLARHMRFCTRLAATAPVCRLRFPHRLDVIPDLLRRLAA